MPKKYGSRLDVWRGNAEMTTGKLTKRNLTKNRDGKIVSKAKSVRAKKEKHLGGMLTTRKKKTTTRLTDISSANIVKGKRRRRRPKY